MQREINRLTGLYRPANLGSFDNVASESAEELAAVGECLLPLRLTSEAHPLREHARLAAQKIAELEAGISQEGAGA